MLLFFKMDNHYLLIAVLIFITSLIIFKKCNIHKENFRLFYESSPSTRNMSYDLRCEPIIPKQNYLLQGSSIEPHYRRKCLDIVSR